MKLMRQAGPTANAKIRGLVYFNVGLPNNANPNAIPLHSRAPLAPLLIHPQILLRLTGSTLLRIMHDAFLEAQDRVGGSIDHHYRVAENNIRLRFAGPSLVPSISRAFAHLEHSPVTAPDLVICIWDSASTGRPLPLLVSSLLRLLKMTWLENRGIRGEILDFNGGRLRAALHGHDSNLLSVIDLEANVGVYWVAANSDIPWYETGAPLRILLYWWFSRYARANRSRLAPLEPTRRCLAWGQRKLGEIDHGFGES